MLKLDSPSGQFIGGGFRKEGILSLRKLEGRCVVSRDATSTALRVISPTKLMRKRESTATNGRGRLLTQEDERATGSNDIFHQLSKNFQKTLWC